MSMPPPQADEAVTVRVRMAGLAVASVGALAALTVLVRQHSTFVASLDTSAHDYLRSLAFGHPDLVAVMRDVTHLGDTVTILVVDVFALVACLVLHRRPAAAFVALIGFGVWALRLVLSGVVARPRPADALWTADGYSFPSGHTANTSAMAVIVVVTCWPFLGRVGRITLAVLATLVIALVAASRLIGGVHWPSDVLGGLLLAAAVVCIAGAVVPVNPMAPPTPR